MGGRGASFNKRGEIVVSFSKIEIGRRNLPTTIKAKDETLNEPLPIIKNANGRVLEYAPVGAEILNVHIFAGEKVQKQFRDAKLWNDKYRTEYGLTDNDVGLWEHSTGMIFSDKYAIEVHIVTHPRIGVVHAKIKDRWNINDWNRKIRG